MNNRRPEIAGICFGVDISPRTKEIYGTDSPLVTLVIEDDENWLRKDVEFDIYWIEDLISVLKRAKEKYNNERKQDIECAYSGTG